MMYFIVVIVFQTVCSPEKLGGKPPIIGFIALPSELHAAT